MATLNLSWQAALSSAYPREKLRGLLVWSNPIRKSVKCSLTGFASQESSLTSWTCFWKLGSHVPSYLGCLGQKQPSLPDLNG